jgi:integrase
MCCRQLRLQQPTQKHLPPERWRKPSSVTYQLFCLMHDLNFQLKQLCDRNRDGSYATQSNRARMLSLIGDQLWEMGFKKMTAQTLGGRHINALLERWGREEISVGTTKNRMAVLRWWAEKVGRQSVIPKSNTSLGIPERTFVTNESKAKNLPDERLAKVKDDHVAYSLKLQHAFGLRREEAIKFIVSVADKGSKIELQPTWTKGGRAREVPIRNQTQRDLLAELHKFAGKGSLIPARLTYIQQLKIYERQAIDAGLNKMHGLRHAYAQTRYLEITGWPAPAVGGPSSQQLTPEQKALDQQARLTISAELGHESEQIRAVYLGR